MSRYTFNTWAGTKSYYASSVIDAKNQAKNEGAELGRLLEVEKFEE